MIIFVLSCIVGVLLASFLIKPIPVYPNDCPKCGRPGVGVVDDVARVCENGHTFPRFS